MRSLAEMKQLKFSRTDPSFYDSSKECESFPYDGNQSTIINLLNYHIVQFLSRTEKKNCLTKVISILVKMATSISTSNYPTKRKIVSILSAFGFLALISLKIIYLMNRSESIVLGQQSNRNIRKPVDVSQNSNSYFTSMEAEFEWNQFMVPGNNPETIDQILSIDKDRETGRRFLGMDSHL